MTDRELMIAYHHALNDLLGLTHRDVQDTHARDNALAVLGEGARRIEGLPLTVAFAKEALASSPPLPRYGVTFPPGFDEKTQPAPAPTDKP